MVRKFDPKTDLLLTAQQVRDFDAWAINTAGIPGIVLMENAGRGCAEFIIKQFKGQIGGKKVCIFCGTGNNGGDGFVIARHLYNAGVSVIAVICGQISKIKGDAETNYKIAANMQIPIKELNPASSDIENEIEVFAGNCCLLVDAIFGTGFKGVLANGFDTIVKKINSLNKSVIAVDIPSGLDCDSGESLGAAVKAAATVTFAAAKKGFKNPQSRQYTGEIYIASIGIEPAQKPIICSE